MNQNQFTGYGGTFEEAINAAAIEALKAWKPAGPDDMVRLQVESTSLLYGGIIGHVGTRVATVSLPPAVTPGATMIAATGTAPGKAELTLKLDVIPDVIYANLMPPVRRPQPHKVGLLLTVTNTGSVDFQGQSPDTGIARFSILHGRTTIWQWPEIVGHVVLPITIKPMESRTFAATWEMADSSEFINADLHAVARFAPSGESAMSQIQVKPVF